MALAPRQMKKMSDVVKKEVDDIEERIDALLSYDYLRDDGIISLVIQRRVTDTEKIELAKRYTKVGWSKIHVESNEHCSKVTLYTEHRE